MTLPLSQRKRLAIIEAAIVEFRLNGFQNSSMDAVAARAEVSKRTVYNHFPSKDALFEELFHQLVDMGRQATQCQFSADEPLESQLKTIALQELGLLGEARFMDLSRIAMGEAMQSPQRAMEILNKTDQQSSNLAQWLAAAMSNKQLVEEEPAYAARQFFGLIKALAFWPQLLTGAAPPTAADAEKIAADAVSMFLSKYRKA